MKRNTLKFDDIKGMLNEDELRGVVGGCAVWTGSGWTGDPSGGYYGGTLDGVTVTAPAPSTPTNSGYPNGTGGSTTGGSTGSGGTTTGGSLGASYAPTLTNAVTYFNQHFANFNLINGTTINFVVAPPPGTVLSANGQFLDKNTGEVFDAQTDPDATGKNFTIYLDNALFSSNASMQELIGHELVHVHNFIDHWSTYVNDPATFKADSEYAAYSYSLAASQANGDTIGMVAAADGQYNNSAGKSAAWQYNFLDVPTK